MSQPDYNEEKKESDGSADDRQEMERRIAFEEDPEGFAKKWENESEKITERIEEAIKLYPNVEVERNSLLKIASRCIEFQVHGHRADIITLKTAKALAAWNRRTQVEDEDIDSAIEIALPHRMRRLPFEEIEDL
jgi:magnesium chelatase subunit I